MIEAALLRQAGLHCSGQKTSLGTRGSAIMIRKQDFCKQPERGKEQISFNSTEEFGNGTRKLNTEHIKVHLKSETDKKLERN